MAEIKFFIKQATDYKENCEAMRQHITKNEFKKDEIVSITSCVKNVKDDDHMLVLFYRNQSDSADIPVDQLQFDAGKPQDDWDDQFEALENLSQENEIIAVGNTPMKSLYAQTIWSLPISKSELSYHAKVSVKVLFKKDGDY